ncbi:MAG: 23S rRNA (adenine(2503)-C(2))-methyltransferase RlmN [Ruminococcaceae bacterium]|nr:23S rRNA (adenine(2503)-C(2))-methyltransferase RlmN [Oscillospiraceae bacterium]
MTDLTTSKIDLLSFDIAELTELLQTKGQPAYRAKSIFKWMHQGVGFESMSDQPARLRKELEDECCLAIPTIRRRLVSKLDGTVKYLFELADGCCIESVFMRYEHGNTVCLSSQAGCRMGCRFCASHIGGFERSLRPSEMLGQVIAASRDTGERVDNLVLMGIGEPLDNYDNVLKFLRLVTAEGGLNIGARHISLSTCGIVPNIDRLAGEGLQITLSVSLHAASDEKRSEIMPVNRKWGVDELLAACRRYFERTGRRISFEYALIDGVNDNRHEALSLAAVLRKHLGKMPIHVNLIPVNEVKESGFSKSSREQVDAFVKTLKEKGINATVRRKLGGDINASCGQLRMNEKSL